MPQAKKKNGRPPRIPREPHSLSQYPTYRMRRSYDGGPLAIPAVDSGYSRFFTAGYIPSWSDFSNLYDMYRVTKLTYKYVCWRTAKPTLTSDAFPTLITALDFNDTVSPANVNTVLEYGNAQIRQFSEGPHRVLEVSYTPKLNYNTPAATVVPTDSGWARTSSTNDVWYGHKEWLSNYNSTSYNETVVHLYVTVDLEFKVSR